MTQEISRFEDVVIDKFYDHFSVHPDWLIKSPGRVNLLGEHTDYNDGFVLPMAIDRYLYMALRKREDDKVRVISEDFHDRIEFSLNSLQPGKFTWGEYITGSLAELQKLGHSLCGFDLVISGNIPVGASLSSSAALEVGILKAAATVAEIEVEDVEMARLAQNAENNWVGMNCGVMDQLICACGKEDNALLIDCRSLETRSIPLPADCSVIILDTTTRRELVDSAYNERRRQCVNAAMAMGVLSLRDADQSAFLQSLEMLSEIELKRAWHVISENSRVVQAAEVMAGGDGDALGRLMYDSHCSLREDFEVSSQALDAMVESSMLQPTCLGARMTGAGFAGCAVALVQKGEEERFMAKVSEDYAQRMGMQPMLYVCRGSAGTSVKSI